VKEKRGNLPSTSQYDNTPMRGHTIVSSDDVIKVIQLKYPKDLDRVRAERERQIALAQIFLKKETPKKEVKKDV
jgi:hypothetical protein